MDNIMAINEAAEKWGVSARRINELILKGQIKGARKIGVAWVIPAESEKPADNRIKSGKYIKDKPPTHPHSAAPADLSGAFQKMMSAPDIFFQFLDLFPYTIEIFAPDGTAVYANRMGYEEMNIADPSQHIGKYNILKDPVVLDVLGQRKIVERAFQGERINSENVRVPYEDTAERYEPKDRSFNKILYYNISCFPIWDEYQQLAYIAMVFITMRTYTGRLEMTRAQEYMDNNWYDSFDRVKIAAAANVSPYHFSRMFKQFAGTPPQDYYVQVKVEKIKEKLCDPNLTVTQAFAECGVDSKGKYLQHFKKIAGMTPIEYRNRNMPQKQQNK